MNLTDKLEAFLYSEMMELVKPFEADRTPLWGTMNATQMLNHLSLAIKASNGALTAPLTSEPEKAVKLKRIVLLSDRPLMKGFDNPILALVPRTEEVITHEDAKIRLQENIDRFRKAFEGKGESFTYTHNMFGPLNYQEWLRFHYKHVHHHLAQFAIIPYVEKFDLE